MIRLIRKTVLLFKCLLIKLFIFGLKRLKYADLDKLKLQLTELQKDEDKLKVILSTSLLSKKGKNKIGLN